MDRSARHKKKGRSTITLCHMGQQCRSRHVVCLLDTLMSPECSRGPPSMVTNCANPDCSFRVPVSARGRVVRCRGSTRWRCVLPRRRGVCAFLYVGRRAQAGRTFVLRFGRVILVCAFLYAVVATSGCFQLTRVRQRTFGSKTLNRYLLHFAELAENERFSGFRWCVCQFHHFRTL
jgi:hypothetical protein